MLYSWNVAPRALVRGKGCIFVCAMPKSPSDQEVPESENSESAGELILGLRGHTLPSSQQPIFIQDSNEKTRAWKFNITHAKHNPGRKHPRVSIQRAPTKKTTKNNSRRQVDSWPATADSMMMTKIQQPNPAKLKEATTWNTQGVQDVESTLAQGVKLTIGLPPRTPEGYHTTKKQGRTKR